MKPEALAAALGGLDYSPLTSPEGGRMLYEFVLGSGAADILELGFAHGTSSCYIGAALDERGAGVLTTIDRASALERRPNIRELLDLTGLGPYVRPIFAEQSHRIEDGHHGGHGRAARRSVERSVGEYHCVTEICTGIV